MFVYNTMNNHVNSSVLRTNNKLNLHIYYEINARTRNLIVLVCFIQDTFIIKNGMFLTKTQLLLNAINYDFTGKYIPSTRQKIPRLKLLSTFIFLYCATL